MSPGPASWLLSSLVRFYPVIYVLEAKSVGIVGTYLLISKYKLPRQRRQVTYFEFLQSWYTLYIRIYIDMVDMPFASRYSNVEEAWRAPKLPPQQQIAGHLDLRWSVWLLHRRTKTPCFCSKLGQRACISSELMERRDSGFAANGRWWSAVDYKFPSWLPSSSLPT